jgi:flagellar protein FlaG
MDFNLPPLGGVERAAQAQRPQGVKAPASADPAVAVTVDTLPASPPDSVLEEMFAASRVADTLHEQGRELHFEPTGNGRVVVEVRDLDGNVIRTIPAGKALDVAAGAPLDN